MKINEYLMMTREEFTIEGIDRTFVRVRPRIVCADGFDVSIQAGEMHYCTPRLDCDNYEEVEIGFPSDVVPEWMEYAETPEDPTGSVYGYVPVEIIDAVLEQHGGIANGVQ